VSPDALSWGISGMLLLMVVLGGKGTLVGSIIGSAIFLLVKNFVSSHTEHWQLIVGGTFVICVMFFPEGIYGLRRWSRSRR
jgi:branched-chain amino acid transport system permease protein